MEQFYVMSWREFSLKSFAYHRKEKDEWKKIRLIAYYTRFAPYIKTDRIPTIEKFMPLDGREHKSEITSEAKTGFMEHFKKYLQQKANKS